MSNSILIMRGQDQGADFAADLKAAGVETYHAPVIEIVAQDFEVFSPVPDALLITSANAANIMKSGMDKDQRTALVHLPIFVVGAQTKIAVENAGFKNIHSAEGDIKDVLALLKSYPDPLSSIGYLRAKNVAADIASALAALDIAVQERVCYAAKPVSVIAPDILEKLRGGRIAAVTFFSKRTAKIFFKNLKFNGGIDLPENTKYLCISPSVLEYVRIQRGGAMDNIFAAHTANRKGMVELVKKHCA